MRPRDILFELVRDGVRKISHLDPALIATAKAATIALGTTRKTCEALRNLGAPKVEQLPLGLDEDELDAYTRIPPPSNGPFRALCLGRLLHWKGFYLAIRAFAVFAKTNPEAELWIIGGGPFQRQLEKTAGQTGMGARVKLLGRVSQGELMDRLAQSHVLMHPALHDNFPVTCLEAMAAGRPVVCLDIGGPAAQVNAETGFVAPAENPEESIQAMASFLTRVANDRSLLARLSANARIRVREEFTMKKMGASMNSLFSQAIAVHAESRRGRVDGTPATSSV
jgi:glycosyltransferase involved in cell wall biosynthesis